MNFREEIIDTKEMLVLLPQEWDIMEPEFGFTYITDFRSPFNVYVKPYNATEEQADLLYAFKEPYSLAHAKLIQVKKPKLELNLNLGSINIYHEKKQTFSGDSKKRWDLFHKRRDASISNLNKINKKPCENQLTIPRLRDIETQTKISGIITENIIDNCYLLFQSDFIIK